MTKINVDSSKCIGCGACVSVYPDNFDFNKETGLSIVTSQENITEDMVDICPVGAIEISGESTEAESVENETAA